VQKSPESTASKNEKKVFLFKNTPEGAAGGFTEKRNMLS
jgi:hypothetical protein